MDESNLLCVKGEVDGVLVTVFEKWIVREYAGGGRGRMLCHNGRYRSKTDFQPQNRDFWKSLFFAVFENLYILLAISKTLYSIIF